MSTCDDWTKLSGRRTTTRHMCLSALSPASPRVFTRCGGTLGRRAAGPRGRRCFPGGVCGPGLSPPASLPCTGLWPPLCYAASNALCAWRRRDLACKRYCLSKIKKQVFIWDAEKISCRHSQLILWLWSHPSSHAFFILNHLALVCIWTAEITGKLNLREVMSWHQYIWQNKLFSAKLWNQ